MLSRVQELQQLVIINSVRKDKIYPSPQAMAELERINLNAFNRNPSSNHLDLKIVSVNIRSLRKHMVDLIKEPQILQSDVILVQQTCLGKNECTNAYQLENYLTHFNSFGDGKGVALYFKDNYEHVSDISKENYQISKIQSDKYDIICVYRSSNSVKTIQIDFPRSAVYNFFFIY
jgi:exonuclease III